MSSGEVEKYPYNETLPTSYTKIYRKVFKHLKDYSIDRIILTEFDPKTLNREWRNGTPYITTSRNSEFNQGVGFNNINTETPIFLELLYTENLSDRNVLEVDIYSTEDIDVGKLNIGLYDAYNENQHVNPKYNTPSPRLVISNSEKIEKFTYSTIKFIINDTITKKKHELYKIKALSFSIDDDTLETIECIEIGRVDAVNPEYTLTLEDVYEKYKLGVNYVLSGLGDSQIPNNDSIIDAVYLASAYYCWLEKSGKENAKEKNTYGTELLLLVDKAILQYRNGGTTTKTDFRPINRLGGYKWSRV